MQKQVVVKGVRFDAGVAPLVPRMELVNDHRESLQRLQDAWEQLALFGQMSGTGADIGSTGAEFRQLSDELLDSLARRLLQDALRTARAKAQTCIDILVRNLFERTADVGFLATDTALRQFAAAARSGQPAEAQALRERLRAYVAKYSVYDDVILLAPDGRLLVRLDETATTCQADEALAASVVQSRAAFVESFGRFELLGGRTGLLYCASIREADVVVGVLCLSFRFEDEMRAIFAGLVPAEDPSVVLLLDPERTVVASSDAFQVPVGARLPLPRPPGHLIRFAGRDHLAVQAPATGYQGYGGPGWQGCVLVPVELAFQADASPVATEPAVQGQPLTGSGLFGRELQVIPARARHIQQRLERLVWNGQVQGRSEAGAGASGGRFASALLDHVTRAGQRISAVFDRAIGDLQQSAVASVLEDAHACAALGIDILDRNLYERANDCRWWALDNTLRLAAAEPDAPARANAGAVLRHINGLYTVYSDMLLLDTSGEVLASSQGGGGSGATVAADWLQAALALRGDQAFVRSAFAASPLYGGRHTYIYAAPVQGLRSGNTGCVAIVFDSAPQMQAMLQDTLPLGPQGQPLPQASGLFVTRSGTVVAGTHPAWPVGSVLPFAERLAGLERGQSARCLLEVGGRHYAAGFTMSGGYREYESSGACSPDDVACVMLIALDDGAAERRAATAIAAFDAPAAPPPGAENTLLASFRAGEQWFAFAAAHVLEAVVVAQVAPIGNAAQGGVTGMAMHQGHALAVIDLPQRGQAADDAGDGNLLVVCRTSQGSRFAVRIDEVGAVFEVAIASLHQLPAGLGAHDPLATHIVRGGSRSPQLMLTLLSVDRLAARHLRAGVCSVA
jgi:chemotaxis signal transduction protein